MQLLHGQRNDILFGREDIEFLLGMRWLGAWP